MNTEAPTSENSSSDGWSIINPCLCQLNKIYTKMFWLLLSNGEHKILNYTINSKAGESSQLQRIIFRRSYKQCAFIFLFWCFDLNSIIFEAKSQILFLRLHSTAVTSVPCLRNIKINVITS